MFLIFRIRKPLSTYVKFSLADRMMNMRDEELPLLFTFTFLHQRGGVNAEVISYIYG